MGVIFNRKLGLLSYFSSFVLSIQQYVSIQVLIVSILLNIKFKKIFEHRKVQNHIYEN